MTISGSANPTTIEISHAFGSQGGNLFRDAALFGDDVGRCLLVPSGRHVAIRYTETGDISFLEAAQNVEGLTSCAVSRDKFYLAIGQKLKGTPSAQISVFDLRKDPGDGTPVVVVEPLARSAGKVVSLSFCGVAPFFLAALCVTTEVSIVVVDWQAERVVTRHALQSPADRVAYSPHDMNLLSASGLHLMRVFKVQNAMSKHKEGSLKMLQPFTNLKEDVVRFADHAWCDPGDGTLVVCCQEGAIYVLDSTAVTIVSTLEPAFVDASGFGSVMPATLRCFSHGFLVGGGEGTLAVWQRVDAGPVSDDGPVVQFKHGRTIQVHQTDAAICSIDLSGSEEELLFAFRNGDVGTMPIATLYAAGDDIACTIVNGGFHGGPVVGLDMAIHRPLVASACKKDGSVRIWNYVTRSCEVHRQCPGESPTGVAIHPTGYFLAVSYSDKLRLFHVLLRELKLFRELPLQQGGRLLRFSHGGHLLALVQGNIVLVYSIQHVCCVATLEGHKVKVSCICFNPDDTLLLSTASDGTIIQWSTQTWQKICGGSFASRDYFCATINQAGEVWCSAGYGSRGYVQKQNECEVDADMEIPDRVRVASICRSQTGSLFLGTSHGSLWVYPPKMLAEMAGKHFPMPPTDQGLHMGSCSAICLSADERTLVTAGDDGVIFVLNACGVQGLIGCSDVGDDVQSQRLLSGAETALMERGEIQQKTEELQLLHAESAALSTKIEEEAARLEEECQQKVFEARQNDQAEIRELKRRCKALDQATIAKERETERIMALMKTSHAQAFEQLSGLYEQKLDFEVDRFDVLRSEHKQVLARIKEVRASGEEQSAREEKVFQEDLERQMAEKDLEIQKHKDLLAFVQQRFEALLEREGSDHFKRITDAELENQQVLKGEKAVEARMKQQRELLLSELEGMEVERQFVEKDQFEAATNIANLTSQCEELARTVNSLKNERKERELTLKDKEARIETYKEKVNTLKKFKHSLDKGLLEVTESVQPKDHTIAQLNENLHELEAEFEKQLAEQRSLEDQMEQKTHQIMILNAEGKELQSTIKEKDLVISSFTLDLHRLVTDQSDLQKWPQEVRHLYHTHVHGHLNRDDRPPLEDLQQQMRLMERRVTTLAARSMQTKAACKTNIQRKAHESALLVHELNEVRVQKKTLQMTARSLRLKLDELQRQLAGEVIVDDAREATPPRVTDAPRRPASAAPSQGRLLPPSLTQVPPPEAADEDGATAPGVPRQPMPRTPSGSLPGPRQQAVPQGGRSTPEPTRRQTRAVPFASGAPAAKTQILTLKSAPQDRRLENLQATADANSRILDEQKAENKLLREQLEKLSKSCNDDAVVVKKRGKAPRSLSAGRLAVSGLA
eukprot:TRINITY_DN61515_c0_g1_i1.p1 TRINITY_DN61515_c0_g1~~TRINITY_DN61515_c0_g1_i1.p1  ORF type:complete len:1359 (-),score=254.25 TRINITY_DN61515_c0_g1_i1:218-4294(-)